jgi:hypothetical protein
MVKPQNTVMLFDTLRSPAEFVLWATWINVGAGTLPLYDSVRKACCD